MKYATRELICFRCKWSTRFKAQVPQGKEGLGVFMRAAIDESDCPRCQLINFIKREREEA